MNEIVRSTSSLEGVILEGARPAPYADAEEAAQVMSDAFTFLRQGRDMILDGHALLEVAEARQAHTILGFDTFQDCVLAGVEQHLRTQIKPEYRRELTLDLRKRYGVSTRELGRRLGVSHMTSHRDLKKSREVGDLVDEGETVVSQDGAARPARRTPPRPHFAKSWETQINRLIKAMASLDKQRTTDDRWKKNRADMAVKHRADLSRVLEQFAALLEDLDEGFKESGR